MSEPAHKQPTYAYLFVQREPPRNGYADHLIRRNTLAEMPLSELQGQVAAGSTMAKGELAYRYLGGEGGVKSNPQAAYQLFAELGDAGDDDALCNLGYMRQNGLGCAKDLKKSYTLYRASAEQGNAAAHIQLIFFYLEGLANEEFADVAKAAAAAIPDDAAKADAAAKAAVTAASTAKAEALLAQYNQPENTEALHSLASHLDTFIGIDYKKQALRFYMAAASWGHVEAYDRYTHLLAAYDKLALPPAVELATCHSAADHGIADAQYRMGLYYGIGFDIEPPSPHPTTLTERFKAAAQKAVIANETSVQKEANGRGITKDFHLSLAYLGAAADQGHSLAQTIIAWAHMDGFGVAQSPAIAFLLAHANKQIGAHETGRRDEENPDARRLLGRLYLEENRAIPRDIGKAFCHLDAAARTHDRLAQIGCLELMNNLRNNLDKLSTYELAILFDRTVILPKPAATQSPAETVVQRVELPSDAAAATPPSADVPTLMGAAQQGDSVAKRSLLGLFNEALRDPAAMIKRHADIYPLLMGALGEAHRSQGLSRLRNKIEALGAAPE